MKQIKKLLNILLCICLAMVTGCSKDNSNDNLPVPGYEQLADAYDEIIGQDPALLEGDAGTFAEALTDELKRMYENDRQSYLESESGRLSDEEWKLIIAEPFSGYKIRYTASLAYNATISSFECNPGISLQSTKADAVRHAYWNILLVKETSIDFAERLSTAHEMSEKNDKIKAMYLHNNQFGRDLVAEFAEATAAQLLELLLNEQFIFVSETQSITNDMEGLVYIAGQEQYDTTLTGSLTNPDSSGGPWDMTFTMHQCGTTVRGHFVITRANGSWQKRRFAGTVSGEQFNLNVTYPYEFETVAGVTPCQNMETTLTGNENALSGSWTSSNCGSGGIITLER